MTVGKKRSLGLGLELALVPGLKHGHMAPPSYRAPAPASPAASAA